MTTRPKTYQNYRFDELIAFAMHNPHRTRELIPIEITMAHRTKNETMLDGLGLKGYTAFDLQPTGLLSMLLCMKDPLSYSLSSPAIRSQELMDLCTRLQEKTEEFRSGPLSRKRRKIYDLLGAVYNESTKIEEKDYQDLFHALEYFVEAHVVMVKDSVQELTETDKKEEGTDGVGVEGVVGKGDIYFSSSPLLWKRDRPMWVADYRCRWLAVPTESIVPLSSWIGEWLPQLEADHWTIHWPIAEGSKTEMVEQLSVLPGWQETDKKRTKDVLAPRLGRLQVLQWFQRVDKQA